METRVLTALARLTAAHAAPFLAIAGMSGLRETAPLAVSGALSIVLSRTRTVSEFVDWIRARRANYRIWIACSSAMALFLAYRSGVRIDVAIAEAVSTTVFFLAMTSIGNRVFKW